MRTTGTDRFYAAGQLRVDLRHRDCDRFDGFTCACGDCSCHRAFPVGALILVNGVPCRVLHEEPDVLTIAHVNTVLDGRGVMVWERSRARYRSGVEDLVVRPLYAVVGADARPAERPEGEAWIEVTMARPLGSGFVVGVLLHEPTGHVAREELVPVYLGPEGVLLPPKGDLLAEVIQRSEEMALRRWLPPFTVTRDS